MAIAVLVAGTAATPAAAENLRKFAGVVVDAKSGKVLYESAADSKRYPASVAKVMTLYVLFQELQAGKIKLSDKITVSKHAASAVPTKLGLKSGSTITVENAIKALVTLSANDMARAIAEHVSGSEAAFARRMTATAKSLGMSRTTYRNASGLPDSNQVTTVRDQAILAVAVYQHFPKYYEFFQTRSFTYNKRTYGNHNRLLGQNGVDGIKTGYINAAGFNLMTAARTGNRHVVVIGFGFNTAGARDSRIRELLKTHMPKARQGDTLRTALIPVPARGGASQAVQVALAQPVYVTPAPLPSFRIAALENNRTQPTVAPVPAPVPVPQLAAPAPAPAPIATVGREAVAVASISPPAPVGSRQIGNSAVSAANALGGGDQGRPFDVIGAWLSDTFSLGAPPAALGQTAPSAPLLPPVGVGAEGRAIDLMTSGSTQSAPAPAPLKVAEAAVAAPAALPSGWVVQIGAAPSENGASSLITDAASKVSALDQFRAYIERFEKNGQVFYRARFTGFEGRDAATNMCNALKKAKMSCLAMQG